MKTRHEWLVDLYRKMPNDKLRELLAAIGRAERRREKEATEAHREELAVRAVLDERPDERGVAQRVPEPTDKFTWGKGDLELVREGEGEPLLSQEELDRILDEGKS